MNKAIQLAFCLSAAGLLALATSCAPAPAPALAPEPLKAPLAPPYAGLWEGTTKKGETCTVRFTATEWECRLESGGVARPYYRGTYVPSGFRVDMTITQEADLKTMGWVAQKGSLGPIIVGRLAGGKLTIQALTDAELERRY